jgi:hypothetical protein
MSDKKLFWINKKGVLGVGKNCTKYGEEIDVKKIGKAVLAKHVQLGNIGQMAVPPVAGDQKKIIELEGKIASLKDEAKKPKDSDADIETLKAEFDEEISKKDEELEKVEADFKEVIDAKDADIETLKAELKKATK